MAKEKKKKQKSPAFGECALLGTHGQFAKSHLIPQSLTLPDVKGARFIEAGRGMRPISRPTSWYDNQLCTLDGERVLRDIDNNGIATLRKHHLIWNSWPPNKVTMQFSDYVGKHGSADINIRLIALTEAESRHLKLFYLSILWRFLSSKRPEFSYLENIGVDLDELASHIRNGTAPARGTYLIQLDQHITRGYTHNQSPTIQEMDIPRESGSVTVQFYRIYFNGLVARLFARDEHNLEHIGDDCSTCIGEAERLLVFTRPFHNSRQHRESEYEIRESFRMWPAESARLGK